MNGREHDRQVSDVRASLIMGETRSQRHGVYPVRRGTGGRTVELPDGFTRFDIPELRAFCEARDHADYTGLRLVPLLAVYESGHTRPELERRARIAVALDAIRSALGDR